MALINAAAFANYSTMPQAFVDELPAGWLDAQLDLYTAKVYARLTKRYATPFASPPPIVACGWLAAIVTHKAYLRRGVDPNDLQMVDIKADADAAWAEIKEAADAVEGLFELPLRADTTASGVSKGAPFVYSEQSPYVGFDRKGDTGRSEDANRGGTFG